MKRFPFEFWIVWLLFLVYSCNLDSLDFNKLSNDVNLSPVFVAPIAKANISGWDLVLSANKGNEDLITKDPNGLIKIVYKQNDLYKYNVRDFINFPSQQILTSGNKQLGEISPGNISVIRKITLSDLVVSLGGSLEELKPLDGTIASFPEFSFENLTSPFNMDQITDFTSVTFSNGSLDIILENKTKVAVTIKGSFFDLENKREFAGFTFDNIAPNEIKNVSVPLAGVQISNNLEFRLKTFYTPGSAKPVSISLSEDYLNLTLNMKDLKISSGNLKVKSQVLEGFTGQFGFTFPDQNMKAFAMLLKKGYLNIKTNNSSKLSGTINLILNKIIKNGSPITASIPLSGNSTSIGLSDADIDFTSDPAQPYNNIPYSYSIQIDNSNGYINYASTDAISLDITLSNLEFKNIHGDFGKRIIQKDPGSFDLNVDMFNKIDGSFKLANPKLELIIHNSIGMPAAVTLNFTGSNKSGESATLNPPVFDIPVPANINAGIATKSIIIDKLNSNIVNFIALPPTSKISFLGQVDFNPTNPPTLQNPNFLDIDATFAIDMAMELPMELQISNLKFRDTVSISQAEYKNLENAELIINAKNGLPLDIDLQLFFIDTISKQQFGTSKVTKILSAAQVDVSGVITPVQSSNKFDLDEGEIKNLSKANGVVFMGIVSSPSSGTIIAPILSDSKIELNLVIKSKVNL